jgi:hypothetical protein
VHAGIRAQYYPDTGTSDLPAPIHGDVHAGFDVRRAQTGSGTRLVISPSSQDAKIQFTAAPGSGLDAFEENVLAIQVRKVLRELMVFLPVDLPANFPFTVFKGLGSGASQAIALPFQLSDPPPPPPASGVQPLTQSFVDSSGFAVAVSKDFVIGLIDTAQIQQIVTDTHLPLDYHLQFTSGPSLTFKTGAIEISGRLDGVPPSRFLPSPFISFTQSVTLVLNTSTQTARLVRVGDPTVDPARSPLQVPRSPALIRSSVVSPRSTSATLTKLRA